MAKRAKTDYIIIHCADTPAGMDVGVKEIREWHLQRGFSDVGYHYVVRRNGDIEAGRWIDEVGAHCKAQGRNHDSIGICLVGGKPDANFTQPQLNALKNLVYDLLFAYPDAKVAGHRDFEDGKTCPNFDIRAWWYGDQKR